MKKKLISYLKIIVVVVIIALFVWFVGIWPTYTFKQNEKKLEEAAIRYYELNKTHLPTGNRIATVTMQTLYHQSYLKEDFYIPYTDEPCSLKESWVKVRRVNGEYKYYTNLKCGVLKSSIDSKGPKIKLNGSDTITIDLGEEYKDPGVKSVVDNTDGKMKTSDVTINTSNVDTNKIGTYEVTYTALDGLKNKTTVTRTVNVVSKIKNAVDIATKDLGYYTGENPNNYVRLSGMTFRIIGTDGDNVRLIASEDVANVNYDGIKDWLDYYMEHFNNAAKELLVKNEYCNMPLTDDTLNAVECTSKTNSRYAYIISITDINKSKEENSNASYLIPSTMSWTANTKDDINAYSVRNKLYGEVIHPNYYPDYKINNFGIRPVITIKGDTIIKKGDGTILNPYVFGETSSGKVDDLINTRHSGEYIRFSTMLWRIMEVNSDGTTKIISIDNVYRNQEPVKTFYETSDKIKIYNPTQKGNVGYFINNKVSEYIDTSYFVNKNIKVPIYESDILYGKEVETKKYKVKLSAPNAYDIFSAQAPDGIVNGKSYWLINSSKKQYYKAYVTDVGVILRGRTSDLEKNSIRVVGNLNKNVKIVKGKGTIDDPYTIDK